MTQTERPWTDTSLPPDERAALLVADGFEKVFVEPGAAHHVSITIDPAATHHPFSTWDDATRSFRILPGEYSIFVGTSADDSSYVATIDST